MSNFHTVIDRYRNLSFSETDKGNRFERLMQAMLRTIPPYSDELLQVWLWGEFPFRQSISLHDTGIDLVAQTTSGDYWAIQCKCYRANARIDKESVDTFLSTSARAFTDENGAKRYFSQRMWIDTTDGGFTAHAAESFTNQAIPAMVLHLTELAEMPVDWEELDKGISGEKAITERKELKPHQQEALDDALNHYASHDRGKLIMACGTGKTFTALRIAEAIGAHASSVQIGEHTSNMRDTKILFLVPSIALLGQVLRAWCFDAKKPIRPMCVCSDREVSRTHTKDDDQNLTMVEELAWPASTDVEQIVHQYYALRKDPRDGMLVVFSTYQSIERVAAAQRELDEELVFDLIICDEAHRTTGVTLKGEDESAFVRVHDNDFIRARKRMYMTATPRLYKEADQKRARENEAYLCSMDDTALYGEEFHRLGFGEAVGKKLLSDYKVLILNVEPEDVSSRMQQVLAGFDEVTQKEVDTDDMAKLIGCINALSKRSRHDNKLLREVDPQPMHRAVAFCQNIKVSKAVAAAFNICGEAYYETLTEQEREGLVHVTAEHVDGSMGAAVRERKLDWLKRTRTDGLDCHLLSNVRCLSEGVDVPSLDAVIFLSAKNSQVDVVQSVGRVMRVAEGKKYGYIIIPIVVPSDVNPEEALDNNKTYAVVWDILNALRAHDDRFNAMVNKLELNKQRPDTVQIIRPGSRMIGRGAAYPVPEEDGALPKVEEERAGYQTALDLRFETLQNVIFARMVQKVGSKRYWEQWAGDVAKIAEKHIEQINKLIAEDTKARKAFDGFMRGLHKDINPAVTEAAAVEMLAQHIITQPVFEALFENYAFAEYNPVSKAMNRIVKLLNDQMDETDHKSLEKFYDHVRESVKGIDNAESKQKIVVELYDKFFSTAFPKVKEQLGIVYTPVEVVDFIIHSVEHVLNEHFGRSLNDRKVRIIDPFTGTGTFITRLLQSGIIKDLEYKYKHEIFANEIVLLAYYIASVNIENVYHDLVDTQNFASLSPQSEDSTVRNRTSYVPFDGICLTDTFELGEKMYRKRGILRKTINDQGQFEGMETPFAENSTRVQRQLDSPITVIMGNPPYSIGQKSANDNAQNQKYEFMEKRIYETYGNSSATSIKALHDSYIKAFRWASDRLNAEYGGIIGFITNSGWLDSNGMDGFRKSLTAEFTDIYVFNLRGAIRGRSGETAKREGQNVFDIMTGVAIILLVKNPKDGQQSQQAIIHYADIGDYLSRKDKFDIMKKAHSIRGVMFEEILPNEHGDWINQRNDSFSTFIPVEPDKKFNELAKSFFSINSLGCNTNRDVWMYNSSKVALEKNMQRTIDFYNSQVEELKKIRSTGEKIKVDDFKSSDETKISWSSSLVPKLDAGVYCDFDENGVRIAAYRPFCKQYFYFGNLFVHRRGQFDQLFPTTEAQNLVIDIPGVGVPKPFSCLITDKITDLNLHTASQCFPLYWYEERKSVQGDLFESGGEDHWIRHEAVTDFILKRAREQYGGKVQKEDIFHYVYGFLHCPAYRGTFANDLKKMLPRLPLVEKAEDFWAFCRAGRELANLHLHYEDVEPCPEVVIDMSSSVPQNVYRVEQMRFGKGAGKEKDRSVIVYNPYITLRNIPLRAYDYVVNGKSAIEWVMERYCDKTDKKSGIRNDANQWGIEHGNPRYPLDLLQSVITLSLRTLDIVDSLPEVTF